MRVVVAEDSYLIREGLRLLLETQDDIDLVATAGSLPALLEAVEAHSPDVVVTDVRMPPGDTDEGIVAAETLARTHPGLGIVVLSQYVEPEWALRLFETGAAGLEPAGQARNVSASSTATVARPPAATAMPPGERRAVQAGLMTAVVWPAAYCRLYEVQCPIGHPSLSADRVTAPRPPGLFVAIYDDEAFTGGGGEFGRVVGRQHRGGPLRAGQVPGGYPAGARPGGDEHELGPFGIPFTNLDQIARRHLNWRSRRDLVRGHSQTASHPIEGSRHYPTHRPSDHARELIRDARDPTICKCSGCSITRYRPRRRT